jgi:hypothetical protein
MGIYHFLKTSNDAEVSLEYPCESSAEEDCNDEISDEYPEDDGTPFDSIVLHDGKETNMAIYDIPCLQSTILCQYRWLEFIANRQFPGDVNRFFGRLKEWSGDHQLVGLGELSHTELITDLVIDTWKTIPSYERLTHKEAMVVPLCEIVGLCLATAWREPGIPEMFHSSYSEFFEFLIPTVIGLFGGRLAEL